MRISAVKSKYFFLFSSLLALATLFLFANDSFAAGQATLYAEPSEVPAGSGFGKTKIFWETTDGANARLFFVNEDGSLKLIGKGNNGTFQEEVIFPNRTYEYRLYPPENTDTPLAALTINGTQKINYAPDFQTLYRKIFVPWTLPLIVIFLLIFAARFFARRDRLKLANNLLTAALILSITGAAVVIVRERGLSYDLQPDPDAQETMDAARQMLAGNGYVTFFHGTEAEPPRYPPGFSIALMPFLSVGEYPANIIFGAKIFALFYLFAAVSAAWIYGGRLAAMLAAIFIGASPFAEIYARLVMSEALTAGLVLLIIILLRKPSARNAIVAGALAGLLIIFRLQMIVCLPALLLALPNFRQRVSAMISASPFLLANGIFNRLAFGSFFKTGYDYWLPNVKAFAVEYAFRLHPQSDGYWLAPDLLRGWLLIWICPCDAGGPIFTLPNIIFYPLVLLGAFWIFAPPFVPLYGLWTAWKIRREPIAKFTLWICVFSVLLFTFYFYKASRFMTSASTLLLILAAIALGKKLARFIRLDLIAGAPEDFLRTRAVAEKNLSD